MAIYSNYNDHKWEGSKLIPILELELLQQYIQVTLTQDYNFYQVDPRIERQH